MPKAQSPKSASASSSGTPSGSGHPNVLRRNQVYLLLRLPYSKSLIFLLVRLVINAGGANWSVKFFVALAPVYSLSLQKWYFYPR